MSNVDVTVIGAGLAGSEAAWYLAECGFTVRLYEMRPHRTTGAHVSDKFAELVCSNSLGSKLPDRATGVLQQELKLAGSHLISLAEASAVPAGGSLAVDREQFSGLVTDTLCKHPRITIIREEVLEIPPTPTIIATGPLTSHGLSESIKALTGQEYLYFYDATSPIVLAESINMDIAFRAGRYDRNSQTDGDYINCPLNRDEYQAFVEGIVSAERIALRDFELEDPHFFEGCLPIEQLASRGADTLAYGPMRPVGLRDPRTGKRPYAVVQLRQDNVAGSLYNIVGFQTNIKWGEQEQVLRRIPGLHEAEFIRMGQMHRNTFLNAPALLDPTMQYRRRPDLFFAGQITGVEGYVGNIATGLVAALNMERHLRGQQLRELPRTTMIGALCHYVANADSNHFQPMKANFGILPPLEPAVKNKQLRYSQYAQRAIEAMNDFLQAGDLRSIQEAVSTQ
jgi:methylenetetrahydrofolate--tRNA-(uracil-5-)-methyltransferase